MPAEPCRCTTHPFGHDPWCEIHNPPRKPGDTVYAVTVPGDEPSGLVMPAWRAGKKAALEAAKKSITGENDAR